MNKRQKGFTALAITIMVVVALLWAVGFGMGTEEWTPTGVEVPQTYIDPGEVQGLAITNPSEAIEIINTIISSVEDGAVMAIDVDVYESDFYLDHLRGNIYVWAVWDNNNTTAEIDGMSGEIISYTHNVCYTEGGLTPGEAVTLAEEIAIDFAAIPNDASSVVVEQVNDYINLFMVTGEAGITSSQTRVPFVCTWTREISEEQPTRAPGMIDTMDTMVIVLSPNGFMMSYSKVWNMDLEEFSIEYTVTEGQAKIFAEDTITNGVWQSTTKLILRPNNVFGEDGIYRYGSDVTLAYEVHIIDEDGHDYWLHIHGTIEDTIIGGDYRFDPSVLDEFE